MAREIEGIAPCLRSAAEILTFPLNAAKGAKLTSATASRDQVVQKDGIQLTSSPFLATHGRDAKLLPIIISNPGCKL